ncbi:unnamed protein product, partial [Mycena citricolor]
MKVWRTQEKCVWRNRLHRCQRMQRVGDKLEQMNKQDRFPNHI